MTCALLCSGQLFLAKKTTTTTEIPFAYWSSPPPSPPLISLSLSVMALGACNPPHWKSPQKEQNVQRKEHNWTRPKRSYIKDSSFPHPRSVFEPVYHLNKPLPTSLHLQRHCLAECRDRVHTSPHSTQPLGRSQVTVHERKAAVTA